MKNLCNFSIFQSSHKKRENSFFDWRLTTKVLPWTKAKLFYLDRKKKFGVCFESKICGLRFDAGKQYFHDKWHAFRLNEAKKNDFVLVRLRLKLFMQEKKSKEKWKHKWRFCAQLCVWASDFQPVCRGTFPSMTRDLSQFDNCTQKGPIFYQNVTKSLSSMRRWTNCVTLKPFPLLKNEK